MYLTKVYVNNFNCMTSIGQYDHLHEDELFPV